MGIFYLVPFHQPISAHAISSRNCHWNVSLPSSALPWNCIFGRVKGQNITLHNQQWLICHKTQPNQTKHIKTIYTHTYKHTYIFTPAHKHIFICKYTFTHILKYVRRNEMNRTEYMWKKVNRQKIYT